MRSWFNWAFRRTNNQQQNIDEDYSAPVSTKSSLNADQANTGGDQAAEPKNTNPEALTPSEIDEGVVFAKNNVFLRVSDSTTSPKSKGNKRGEEHASNSGYFYMRAHEISFHGNTYIVHWLANSELKRAASGEPSESTSTSNDNNAVTIELNTLEMIRIFYDSEATVPGEHSLSNGQMVLYSKDGVFHIFKFISGGLEKLTDLLRECKFLREAPQEMDQGNHKQVMFVVYAPRLGLRELHPAEHEVQTQLNKEAWDDLHDRYGRITALKLIQKIVFFRGVSGELRKEVWPFLLGIFSWKSTTQERLQLVETLNEDYRNIQTKREGLIEEAKEAFKQAEVLIERDVVRTRCTFSDSTVKVQQNTDLLRSVLLAYALYDPMVSYTQGMTDLLAPLLVGLEDEAMSFWCFTKLVERSVFFKRSSVSLSMEDQLELLRPLTELLLPEFYNYVKGLYHGLDFLFCHRWLLVCFKREFVIEDAMLIWEACWIDYETTHFHLFLCVAIMAMYGMKAVEKSLGLEELTIHFNSLPLMPANVVLSQARGFLYQLTRLKQVPCVLKYIINDSDTWDRPGRPKLVCICNSRTGVCSKDTLQASTFC